MSPPPTVNFYRGSKRCVMLLLHFFPDYEGKNKVLFFLAFSIEKRANFDYNRVFGNGEFNDRRGERRAASRIALSADRHSVLIDNLFKFIRHAIIIRYFIISFNLQRFIKSISKN